MIPFSAGDIDGVVLNFDEGSLDLLRYVLAAIMLGIALDIKVSDFRRALRKPCLLYTSDAADE